MQRFSHKPTNYFAMSFKGNKEKFEILEQDVFDSELVDLESDISNIRSQESETTRTAERTDAPEGTRKGKNKFGWAFFLFFLFSGLGFTATFDSPLGLFLGMGTGFLFFVDPIYEKVMSLINRI